jgi:hypothetical protein
MPSARNGAERAQRKTTLHSVNLCQDLKRKSVSHFEISIIFNSNSIVEPRLSDYLMLLKMNYKSTPYFLFFTLLIFCRALGVMAQTDSVKRIIINSVYIAEKKPSFSTTSRNIVAITGTEMKEKGAQTLSDGLAGIPGVSQLTTGAISKPVIRGLYGNRILVNVAGLKLEDQQWEDEHGLGLSRCGGRKG